MCSLLSGVGESLRCYMCSLLSGVGESLRCYHCGFAWTFVHDVVTGDLGCQDAVIPDRLQIIDQWANQSCKFCFKQKLVMTGIGQF